MISLLALLVPAALAHSGSYNVLEVQTRLTRDLMANYDMTIAPQMESDQPFNVSAGLSVYTMDMDDKGLLDAVIWFRGNWQDDRLTWNPHDYHGITEMRIPASRLWVPDLEIYNAEDYGPGSFSDTFLRNRNHYAIVYSTGNILYIPPTKLKVRCDEQEYANWPWGEYDCKIKIGPWTHSSLQMSLSSYADDKHLDMEGSDISPLVFTQGSFSNDPLENKIYDCCPEVYQSINFAFKVQRRFRLTPDGLEKNPNEVIAFKPEKPSLI
jgi:nicotinic acetylcholine receptor